MFSDKNDIKNIFQLIRIIWKRKKARILLIGLIGVLSGISSFNITYFFKMIIELLDQNQKYLFYYLSVFLAINLICITFSKFIIEYLFPKWNLELQQYMNWSLHQKYLKIEQEELFKEGFFDLYTKASEESRVRITEILNLLQYTTVNLFSAAGVIGVIATMEPILIILAIIPVYISLFVNLQVSKYRVNYQNEIMSNQRKINYLIRTFTKPEYMEEIRTKNYYPLFHGYYDQAVKDSENSTNKWMKKVIYLSSSGANLFTIINYGIPMILLGFWLLLNKISVGDYTTLLVGTANLSTYIFYVMILLPKFQENGKLFGNYLKFMDYGEDNVGKSLQGVKSSKHPFDTIVVTHVSYTYPNAIKKAVDDVSLLITKGKHIAIVGENGAGKSTFLALLLKILEPQSGEISINELPYHLLSGEEVRSYFGTAFQSYTPLAFTIRENLEKAEGEALSNDNIDQAMRQTGLFQKTENLSNGYDTEISKEFSDTGIEFSGGEKQKFAIAQLLLMNREILILDEPGSNMDVFSQMQLYTLLSERKDKTIIFVTHQLYAAKDADEILFFDKGKIRERGTHEELMKENGQYAKMYLSQVNHFEEP